MQMRLRSSEAIAVQVNISGVLSRLWRFDSVLEVWLRDADAIR